LDQKGYDNTDKGGTLGSMPDMNVSPYLQPTEMIDSQHPRVIAYAQKTTQHVQNQAIDQAVALYYAVRDDIRYDPYSPFFLPEHYRASRVLKSQRGYCVCKASLLCALGRCLGIPSRIGFATVRNHLATRELLEFLGSDLFVFHGYTEFLLNDQWVKATPAFNKELCHRHHVAPLEFNGHEDSVFQAYNTEDQRFMEYIEDHGVYADIPLSTILAAWETTYGQERVQGWIHLFETQGQFKRNFETETVVTP
jgi:transglutaminase-like putative cysteine protease